MPPPDTGNLSRLDAYAFARALVGLSWDDGPVSPLTRALLTTLDPNKPTEMQLLRQILTPNLIWQILAVNPNAPMPVERESDVSVMPTLQKEAQLTTPQLEEAAHVGQWVTDYVVWAGASANETPLIFHEGAALYLAAVAIGRRLYINTPWRQQVFPNLYVMIVAISTYYRKSAGLSLGGEVARAAIPHMIMPQPGSPENFMNMLGGILPANFESIPEADRDRLTKGNRFAAQRGILRDELSGLFKSMTKDYMSGMKELIMQLYDCPPYLDSNTNNRGIVVIRDTALSILGAATPAELGSALTMNDWYNGNLARFALLTPEPDYRERLAPKSELNPSDLVNRLRKLHEKLPQPSPLSNDDPVSTAWALSADIWQSCHAYEQALRKLTAPTSSLDDRLRAVYGRLHVQALKIAICLAALDWADSGASGRPVVRPAHWYRAQQIAETWRASAHRLLHELGDNEELRLEIRVLRLLRANADGMTVRSIYRSLKVSRKVVLEALNALEQDGRVSRTAVVEDARPGPRLEYFRLVD
jgi:hypothetical protein